MTWYLTLFGTSLAYIALRAFQQQNVAYEKYWWVPPTTFLMACLEIVTITTIVKAGTLLAALPMTAGGVLGCWAAMYIHRRMRANDST